jgi:hypothetical protein
MYEGSFATALPATSVVVGVRSSIDLILIGILGLIEAGCGPPR